MNEIDCHKCFITDDFRKHTIMHLGKTLNIYAVCRKKSFKLNNCMRLPVNAWGFE